MKVDYGEGKTKYGPGVSVDLSGDEVAIAIDAYLVAHGVHVSGPRTVTVNDALCKAGHVYVDPSGFVIDNGEKLSGRGPGEGTTMAQHRDIPIMGIMLRKEGDYTIVDAEIGGAWIEVIRERSDGAFSHIAEPDGMYARYYAQPVKGKP